MQQGKTVGHRAALSEQEHGYGCAEVVELDYLTYDKLFKQDFDSAVRELKAFKDQLDIRSSTSAPSSVQPGGTSVPLHAPLCSTENDPQVLGIDDSGDSSVTTLMSTMTETPSNTTQAPPESNDAQIKASNSPGHSANPFTSRIEGKAEIVSNTNVGPLKISTAYEKVWRSENAATSNSGAITPVTATAPISTLTTKSSNSTPDASKSTAPACKLYAALSSATTADTQSREAPKRRATISTSPAATSELSSKTQSRSRAATVVRAASCEFASSSKTESTTALEATCRTLLTSVAAGKTTEASFRYEKRLSANALTVGLNQLIKVSCGQKKQVYCRLCSVRLLKSDHTCSAAHQLKYVKMKFPQWSCKPSELQNELRDKVAQLAEDERKEGSVPFPRLLVTIDVYKELADLPAEIALERLKATLRRSSGVTSPATGVPVPVLRLEFPGASQSEASSPVDDIESRLKEGSFTLRRFNRAQSLESSEPEADDQILDQLHCILNKKEPIANPLIQDVAAKHVNPQTPVASKEAPEWRQPQERSHAETREVLEGSQKTSPVNPVVLPKISIGECTEGSSYLSSWLKVGHDNEPVIGMGFVWECRFVSEVQGLCRKPFFLCESCSVMLPHNEICKHMVGPDHQVNYIMSQHPDLLYFWPENYRLQYPDIALEKWMKFDILKSIAQMLSEGERYLKTDAQSILLGLELYERVRNASFSEALQLLKNIKRAHKLSVCCPSISIPQRKDRHPENQHSPEESLFMEPAQTLETHQRSDNEPIVQDNLDGVKQSGVFGHLDVTSVSSKANSVSPVCSADPRLSHREQPNPGLSDSRQQRLIQELPGKLAEAHSESTSSSVVCPPTTQTLPTSSRDQSIRILKRPAVESIDSLIRSSTDNPDITDPLPAKCKLPYTALQPIIEQSPESDSKSTHQPNSVNPAATSIPLSPQDKDPGTVSHEQDVPVVDQATFDYIMALFRERQSEGSVLPCTSAPVNGETTTSCANSASESGVKRRFNQNSANQKVRNLSLENVKGTKNPALLNPLAEKPSLDGFAEARGEIVSVAGPAKAVGTMSPLVSPADPGCPRVQTSINARTTFRSTSQSIPSPIDCAVVSSSPGHTAQPQDNRFGADQQPINAIVSVRSEQPGPSVIGGINKEDFTKLNRSNPITPCFSSVPEMSRPDAPGRYDQYNRMAYVADRRAGYFSSGAVGICTTPSYRPVYTGSSFQCEGYPAGVLHFPSQIQPEQETTSQSLQSFGNGLATPLPPQWVRLGMQQQQLMQQQQQSAQQQQPVQQQQLAHQQQFVQQQLTRQHCFSWTSTSLAAGNSIVTNEAAYAGATSFNTPNISHKPFSDYDYRIALDSQNSNNLARQHNPPGFNCPPAANTQVVPLQTPPPEFYFNAAPPMVDGTPP